MKKDGFLGLRLEREIHEKVQQYAKDRSISMSDAARELLKVGLRIENSRWKFLLKFTKKM